MEEAVDVVLRNAPESDNIMAGVCGIVAMNNLNPLYFADI